MGATVTKAFAEEGCDLVLIGRDVAAIRARRQEVRALGGKAIVVACDITDPAECKSAGLGRQSCV